MNDREFGNKIKQDLNYGLGQLEARVSDRLKLAREQCVFTLPSEQPMASAV